MYRPLHYRLLERDKVFALQTTCWDFDKHMSLSAEAKSELSWWINNIVEAHNILTREAPTITLTTDASKLDWGAELGTPSTGGLWSSTERQNHINYLELLVVFLGLQIFCSSKNDCHVRLMINNTMAVAVINHMGTGHSDPLKRLTRKPGYGAFPTTSILTRPILQANATYRLIWNPAIVSRKLSGC